MYKVSSKNAKVVFFENIENLEVFVNLIENDVNVIKNIILIGSIMGILQY